MFSTKLSGAELTSSSIFNWILTRKSFQVRANFFHDSKLLFLQPENCEAEKKIKIS